MIVVQPTSTPGFAADVFGLLFGDRALAVVLGAWNMTDRSRLSLYRDGILIMFSPARGPLLCAACGRRPPFNHTETPDVRQQDQEIMQLQSNAATGFVC